MREQETGCQNLGKHSNGEKLLSICIPGRNDDYMRDFRYRITTTINHLARSIEILNLQAEIEILVTDWGSSTPLSHVLALTEEASKVCRFVYVTPTLVEEIEGNKNAYHTAKAYNTGIRRAKGQYIVYYAADTLLTIWSLEHIVRFIRGCGELSIDPSLCYSMIPRIDIPWQFIARRPSIQEWDRYLLLSSKTRPLEPVKWYSLFAGIGAIVAHRNVWHSLRGVDEALGGWGWIDVDLGIRASQTYPQISLSTLGVVSYHMEHHPSSSRQGSSRTTIHGKSYVNDENWGLAQFNLVELESGGTGSKYGQGSQLSMEEAESKSPGDPTKCSVLKQLKDVQLIEQATKAYFTNNTWLGKVGTEKFRAFLFLSWYSLRRFPRRYLDFSNDGLAVELVGKHCPSVEIYKVGCWEGAPKNNSPFGMVSALSGADFRGYLRFVNGELKTSIKRLRESFIGRFEFDLIYFEESYSVDLNDTDVSYLSSYLSSDGALILNLQSAERLERIWGVVQNGERKFSLYRSKSKKVGMVLANPSETAHNFVHNVDFSKKEITVVIYKKVAQRILISFLKCVQNPSWLKRLLKRYTNDG